MYIKWGLTIQSNTTPRKLVIYKLVKVTNTFQIHTVFSMEYIRIGQSIGQSYMTDTNDNLIITH
jgi:hypothetical protein